MTTSLWTRILAAGAGVAIIGASIVLSTRSASAAGLEAFASCEELRTHMEAAASSTEYAREVATEDNEGGGTAAPATTAGGGQDLAGDDAQSGGEAERAGDGTNTQVEGVDELDLVEVLADGRILAVRTDRVVLIDATGERILASLPVTAGEITFDDEHSTLWAVGSDGLSTTLTRSTIDGDAFTATATWTVAGRLVDLRRSGGTVHLVAVDDEVYPVDLPLPIEDVVPPASGTGGGSAGSSGSAGAVDDAVTTAPDATGPTTTVVEDPGSLPFAGTSPVPCDEVLHSPLPGGPATTLVASFSAEGALEPIDATEIVGAGDNVLVTDTALYVSTPSYEGEQPVTGIHRFALDGLTLTGSGSVTGRLINQFALDEHAGHLRAAVVVGDPFMVGMPMPVEGDGAAAVDVAVDDVAAQPQAQAPLNEIVTFDLDGALDIVGRSARFGHEGETLHGIRFAGDVAYAVTFLQTDPLFVIDLAQPTAPRVLGEIQVPGFSAYLHPISPTRVIGFGPSGENDIVARLFDVSDPTSPQLLDTASLGADSPIVYDHHALRTVGDQLVVAANEWVAETPAGCGPIAEGQAQLDAIYRQLDQYYAEGKGDGQLPPEALELQRQADALSRCVYPSAFPQARIVTLTPGDAGLGLATVVTDAGEAQRVLPLPDGYLVVGPEITRVSTSGATQAVLR